MYISLNVNDWKCLDPSPDIRYLRQLRLVQLGKGMKKYFCARSRFMQASFENSLLLLLWLLDLPGLPHDLHLTEQIA
jgi:hypothetical protein